MVDYSKYDGTVVQLRYIQTTNFDEIFMYTDSKGGYIMVTAVTTDAFGSLISDTGIPVVLDFWAAWCGPCRSFSSVIDRVAEEYEGRIYFGKVNVDEEPKLAEKFHVMSIPTVVIFNNGELKETLVGSRSYQDLVNVLELYLL